MGKAKRIEKTQKEVIKKLVSTEYDDSVNDFKYVYCKDDMAEFIAARLVGNDVDRWVKVDMLIQEIEEFIWSELNKKTEKNFDDELVREVNSWIDSFKKGVDRRTHRI